MASPLSLKELPAWFTDPTRGCADPGDVLWFSPDIEGSRQSSMRFNSEPARRICRRCPFVNKCLEYALKENIKHGIWGGTDERQRRAIAKCLKRECGNRCRHPYRERKKP